MTASQMSGNNLDSASRPAAKTFLIAADGFYVRMRKLWDMKILYCRAWFTE